MAVQVKVRHDRQIICPVRFARAVGGAPVIDAPDVDDRGFAMGNRAGSWGQSRARGAMVGITEGDTVRVKVLREDIDSTTPLFATSTDPACAEVAEPAGGGPIPADGVFKIKGVKDFKNRAVSIQVRLGSAEGPVLGEIEPHVFQLRTLRVRVHLVSINGVSTARDQANVTAVFQEVNAIWRPAGIEFRLDEFVRTNVNGFAVAGQVTTNTNGTPPSWNEFSRLINTNFSRTKINIYCIVQNNGEWIGLTFDNDVARPAAGVAATTEGYGIAVEDAATPNTFAHELGHYLDLDDHANADAAGAVVRRDIWVRRCMMSTPRTWGDLTAATPPEPGHRNDIGYGAGLRGALITLKNFPADPRDDEVNRTRRRSLNPY